MKIQDLKRINVLTFLLNCFCNKFVVRLKQLRQETQFQWTTLNFVHRKMLRSIWLFHSKDKVINGFNLKVIFFSSAGPLFESGPCTTISSEEKGFFLRASAENTKIENGLWQNQQHIFMQIWTPCNKMSAILPFFLAEETVAWLNGADSSAEIRKRVEFRRKRIYMNRLFYLQCEN